MERERLTITLGKTTLAKVDSVIDGTKIRNRSHAIEYLITQQFVGNVRQAVILAGGKGLRMRPFTFEMPKGLFPVGGKPILFHIIETLKHAGVLDIVISIGHLGEKIQEYFGDGKAFGVNISYVKEEQEAGTGGALVLAQKNLRTEPFLVFHGDILIDIQLSDFCAFHGEQGTLATMALAAVVDPSRFGEVLLHGSKVKKFVEKPKKGMQLSQLVSCGVYVFEPQIFEYIPQTGFSLLETVFPKLAQEGQLSGFIFEGRWIDIGTPSSYEQAIQEWGKKEGR